MKSGRDQNDEYLPVAKRSSPYILSGDPNVTPIEHERTKCHRLSKAISTRFIPTNEYHVPQQ